MINQTIKPVPITSPLKGVNTIVNREGQPPDTCWNAVNMLPFDRYGRKRVAQRPGLTNPFLAFEGSGFIQNLLAINNIVYPSQAFTAPTIANGGLGGVPLFFFAPSGTLSGSTGTPTFGPGSNVITPVTPSPSDPNQIQPPNLSFLVPFTVTGHGLFGASANSFTVLTADVSLLNGNDYQLSVVMSFSNTSNAYFIEGTRLINGTNTTANVVINGTASGTITVTGTFLALFNAVTGDFNFQLQIISQSTTGTNTIPLPVGTTASSAVNLGPLNFNMNTADVSVPTITGIGAPHGCDSRSIG